MPPLFRPLILWLHLLGTFVWIGGLLFHVLVLLPAMMHRDTTVERLRFGLSLEARFRQVMWPAVGLVLFTGLVNLLNVWHTTLMPGGSLSPAFMGVLGSKLVLVLGIVVFQAGQQFILQPRRLAVLGSVSATAQALPAPCRRLQRLAFGWSLLTLVLASAALWCAVLLRQG